LPIGFRPDGVREGHGNVGNGSGAMTDHGGEKRRSGNSATGMSVALTVVKPGGFMNRLLIIGLLVMFTLPL